MAGTFLPSANTKKRGFLVLSLLRYFLSGSLIWGSYTSSCLRLKTQGIGPATQRRFPTHL
jgi:hypothetical protein